MFEEFFHLRENPFALAPNPRFIFRSHEHTEALAHLRYWVENGEGFVLITGEVGTGKTTALFDLMGQLPNEWAVAFVANSTLSGAELLEEICRRFQVEIPAVASKPALLERLEQHLGGRSDQGLGSVLILDEAQNYENRLLEEVRLLSNLERPDGKLIQIALVGQPELERKLEQPELRQLRQRIGIRYRLNPLTEEETISYVHHRLSVAGGEAERIFPRDSGVEVHRLTHGIPREINIVASQALISAFVQGAAQVGPEHVRNVVLDFAWSSILGRGPLPPVSRTRESKPPGVEAGHGPGSSVGPTVVVPAPPPPVGPPQGVSSSFVLPTVAPPPTPVVPEPARLEPRETPQPAAAASVDRAPTAGDPRQRPPLEVVRGQGAAPRPVEPPQSAPPITPNRPIPHPTPGPGASRPPAGSHAATRRPEAGGRESLQDTPIRAKPGRVEPRVEGRRMESRAERAEKNRGRLRWEDRRPRDGGQSRSSPHATRSHEDPPWIQSLTERESEPRRPKALGWWVLVAVIVLAGAIFLWSERGAIFGHKTEKAGNVQKAPSESQPSSPIPGNALPGNAVTGPPSSATRGSAAVEPAGRGATSPPPTTAPAREASQKAGQKLRSDASLPRSTGGAARPPGGVVTPAKPASATPSRSAATGSPPPAAPPSGTAPTSGSPPRSPIVPPAPGPDAPRPRPIPYAVIDDGRALAVASQAVGGGRGPFAIQIAAFQGDGDAVEQAQVEYQQAYSDPIEIVTAQVNAREWHRVCLGRYDSWDQAQGELSRLKAAGRIQTGVVRRLPGITAASD